MKQHPKSIKLQVYRILIILMLLFAIPIALSWTLYYGNIHLHWGRVNNGYLFKQPLQLKQLSVKLIDGSPVTTTPESHKWNILYLNADETSSRSFEILDKINRIRLALGKDFSRVKESYGFSFQPFASNVNQTLANNFHQISQLAISNNYIKKLLVQVPQVKTLAKHDAIFIIDPHGNIMLAYQADVKPEAIYKDLERLLKYSTIG